MAIVTDLIRNVDLSVLTILVVTSILIVHVSAYLLDPQRIRFSPGPFVAKFTDAWLGWVINNGRHSEVIHEIHLKYGPIVRLAPNHISIADPEALSIVYAHGNGALKSAFYDAFVSFRPTIFSTRDRDEHTRKRKIISHIFSPKSVIEFEPHIRTYVVQLLAHWDRLCNGAVKGLSGTDGEGGWRGEDGRLWFDCLPWLHYLAFDIVGDLAFGEPFGMIEAMNDVALAPKRPEDAIKLYGSDTKEIECKEIESAVQVLNGREKHSTCMGVLPKWWHPIIRWLPSYRHGQKEARSIEGIATMAVAKRLLNPTDRVDLLSKLKVAKDGEGSPMDREELTAEALTLLIAGSDTISNSSCAIIYNLARDPRIQEKLHKELDEQLGTDNELTVTYDQVKRLPYMDACINEGLRILSTVAMGLPRVVPKGGLTVLKQFFTEGTVLSVPSYSIHRDPRVWGEDVETYRPERWFEVDAVAAQKCFNPFSVGPRACVGRNLAFLELQIIIASIMHRYHFVLENPDEPLRVQEGFIRKALECKVGVQRRESNESYSIRSKSQFQ